MINTNSPFVIEIQNEAHWHALRKENIGGSEIAALFGESSYLTRFELWVTKSDKLAQDWKDNDRMFWGRHLESGIASGLQEKRGWMTQKNVHYFLHETVKGMGCTPDYFIIGGHPKNITHGVGNLQIKTVDWLVFKQWEDEQPPMTYQLQVQQEMACTGLKWSVLAVLVGGNDLKLYEYDYHAGAVKKLESEVIDFWKSVSEGKAPPVEADDFEIAKKVYLGMDAEIDLTGDNELPELCARALAAAKRKSEAEKEEKSCKAAIIQKMGDYAFAICSGFIIKATQVNKAAYMVKEQSYKMFKIKELAA